MTRHADAIRALAESQRARFEKHKTGGRLFSFDLVGFISACKDEGIPIGAEELQFIQGNLDFGSIDRPFTLPDHITRFMANIAKPYSPRTVLEPWPGIDLLGSTLRELLNPHSVSAYTQNAVERDVFSLLVEASYIDITFGDPLECLQTSDASFDLAIGCPPIGVRAKKPLTLEVNGTRLKVKDDYGFLLILESCRHLTENGLGVFIVPNSFFFRSCGSGKARHTLELLGVRVVAAIELPVGTFQRHISVPTHLVVLKRSDETMIFTGRFSPDSKPQNELLRNLRQNSNANVPQLGRIVDASKFRSFTKVELSERLEDLARRTGLVPYSFGEVVIELNVPASSSEVARFEEKPNSVYLPQMATTAATTMQDNLPEGLKSYFQLVINTDVADAEFVAGLFTSPFGQLWRDLLRTGDTIPRISKGSLEGATFYLPPKKSRATQAAVLECQHTLSRLRNEINELETQLWKRPTRVDEVQSSIRTINRDNRIESWLDSLPFPLASILWVCHTQEGSMKEKYERKLQFFEALAEFLGVVHLSAFSANQNLWPDLRNKLKEALENNDLSLDMATFGTWKAVVEMFCAEARRLLGNDEESAFELFKTRNREVLETLTSKRIVTVIQNTNKLRNDWMGHTGIVSDKVARSVNELLDQHIRTVREVFGVVWEEYELLLPGGSKLRSGTFHFTTKKIMGTRTPFPTQAVTVVEPLEDGYLHLKTPSESRGLKLLPLVKMMPSPKTEENACYFYNRTQRDGIRFLSYYFESDSEVVAEFGDVACALGNLMTSTSG